MQVLTSDGARIDVRVDGDGARTVVLVAGFPLSREIWDIVATKLAATHVVVRPDLRGMGASAVADGPYLMETLAGDIAAVLDALGIERATLVGHSLGGYVALAFARMFSERLVSLGLVCSRLAADSPVQARSRDALAERLERENTSEILVSAYADRLLSQATKTKRADVYERVVAMIRCIDPLGAAAMLRGMAMRAASDDIAPELRMPVLVVAGGDDAVVPLEESRRVAAAFPSASLQIAQRSGHLPMLEEPERTASFLSDWLAKISAT
jgi:3-oxoadipate enol-lactonase